MSAADRDAEVALIGSVLLDNQVIAHCVDVPPEAFDCPAHALIWDAMLSLHVRREVIDIVTLAAQLRVHDRLNTIGGPQYLAEITDAIPTSAHAAAYSRIVLDCWRLRTLGELGRHLTLASTVGNDTGPILDRIEKTVAEVSAVGRGLNLRPVSDGFDSKLASLDGGSSDDGKRVPTGWRDLDQLLGGGLQPGYMTLLGARPAMGKTSMAIQLAGNWASMDLEASRGTDQLPPVTLFFSLEMPTRDLVDRLCATRAGIDVGHLSSNCITQGEWNSLHAMLNRDYCLPLWISDDGDVSVRALAAAVRRVARVRKLRGVVIDYLQLLKAGGKRELRHEDVSEVSGALRMLAKELGVPIVALAQLNRKCEDRPNKRPGLADLRESGSLEQDAAVVMFLYRDEVYNKDTDDKGIAEIIVSKSRNGKSDTVKLKWVSNQTALRDTQNGFPELSVGGVTELDHGNSSEVMDPW